MEDILHRLGLLLPIGINISIHNQEIPKLVTHNPIIHKTLTHNHLIHKIVMITLPVQLCLHMDHHSPAVPLLKTMVLELRVDQNCRRGSWTGDIPGLLTTITRWTRYDNCGRTCFLPCPSLPFPLVFWLYMLYQSNGSEFYREQVCLYV